MEPYSNALSAIKLEVDDMQYTEYVADSVRPGSVQGGRKRDESQGGIEVAPFQ